jgi:FixJ family two-component response regulator
MRSAWQKLTSFLSGRLLRRESGALALIPVVALIVTEQDRGVVSKIAGPKPGEAWEVHFAESFEEALAFARRLSAPVILLDRDWPGTDWKTAIENLAALPHNACVILVSGVADTYLLQEVVRLDGYDILAKPLRAENVLRAVKLALSYWSIRAHPFVSLAESTRN